MKTYRLLQKGLGSLLLVSMVFFATTIYTCSAFSMNKYSSHQQEDCGEKMSSMEIDSFFANKMPYTKNCCIKHFENNVTLKNNTAHRNLYEIQIKTVALLPLITNEESAKKYHYSSFLSARSPPLLSDTLIGSVILIE